MSVKISADIETALRDEILAIARENDRTFAAELRRALRLYVLEHQLRQGEKSEEEAVA